MCIRDSLCIVIRQDRGFPPQRGARFELESITRQVPRPERQALLDRVEKHFLRLPGQAVHQVEADVGEPLFPRKIDRVLRLLERVDTPDAFQFIVMRGQMCIRDRASTLYPARSSVLQISRLRSRSSSATKIRIFLPPYSN